MLTRQGGNTSPLTSYFCEQSHSTNRPEAPRSIALHLFTDSIDAGSDIDQLATATGDSNFDAYWHQKDNWPAFSEGATAHTVNYLEDLGAMLIVNDGYQP